MIRVFWIITKYTNNASLFHSHYYSLSIGFEPMTFRLTAECSNQLSYESMGGDLANVI